MRNILLLLTITIASGAYAQQLGVKHYSELEKAPSFTLSDTSNNIHKTADYRGRVLIINFWATWCIPCRKEIPALKHAWRTFNQENIQLLGIATKDSIDTVIQFQKENNIEFPLPMDKDGKVADDWRVIAVPTAFVIDPNGHIAMRIVGGDVWNRPELIESIIALKYTANITTDNQGMAANEITATLKEMHDTDVSPTLSSKTIHAAIEQITEQQMCPPDAVIPQFSWTVS